MYGEAELFVNREAIEVFVAWRDSTRRLGVQPRLVDVASVMFQKFAYEVSTINSV